MKKITLILLLVSWSFIAKAQIYFYNSVNEPVYVSLAQTLDKGACKGCWYTHGWIRVVPGEKKMISTAIGLNPNVYYYAIGNSGKEYGGDYKFLVTNSNYNLLNADKEYVKQENPSAYWKGFRHVRTAKSSMSLKLKHTIELTY